MKTIQVYLILVLILLVSTAIAQNESGKTSFAILGGVNFQNLNGEDMNGDKLENDLKTGFHFGTNVQIPVAPEFYFQPGLQFSTKGAGDVAGVISGTYKLSYIELPLSFVYKGLLGQGYIMVGFGPYLAYGIGGKATTVNVTSDIQFKNEVKSGDDLSTVYIKPFDSGGNIFFGYEMAGGLFVQLNAQLGMANIKPGHYLYPEDDSTLKNTGYGLSLGYRF